MLDLKPEPETKAPEKMTIVEAVKANPVIVFTDEEKFNAFLADVQKEADTVGTDVDTKEKRAAIRSMAAKIAKTKKPISDAGKALGADYREKLKKITSASTRMIEELDALRNKTRKPLTEWEEKDEARKEAHREIIAEIRTESIESNWGNIEWHKARIDALANLDIDSFEEFATEAQVAIEHTLTVLRAALPRRTEELARQAELERLKQEADQRQNEQDIAERERREAEAVANAAEEAAATEVERVKQEAQRKIDEERQAREDLIREQAAKEAREKSEKAAAAAAEKQRQADKEYRRKIFGGIKVAIIEHGGISNEQAILIVKAMVRGDIPNVVLNF